MISIRPLSDALNPNFVNKNIFDKTSIGNLLLPGKKADDLQQYREDRGLSLAEDWYKDFFDMKDYEKYFSPYGWANINLVDEFAARSLVHSVTGSAEEGESVRQKIQKLLLSPDLATKTNIRDILGFEYESVFPFINVEPPMNVNFVDPFILKEIVAYPEYKVVSPGAKSEAIIAKRVNGGVSAEDITSILDIDVANRLNCYFGSITWFFEIRVKDEAGSVIAVICRLPSENGVGSDKPVYKQIELRSER
jgi:hypothetical protein